MNPTSNLTAALALTRDILRRPVAETLVEIARRNEKGERPSAADLALAFHITIQAVYWRVRPLLQGRFIRRIGRGFRSDPIRYEVAL